MKRSMRLWLTLALIAAFALSLRSVSVMGTYGLRERLNLQSPSSTAKPDELQAARWFKGGLSPSLTLGDPIDLPDEAERLQGIWTPFQGSLAWLPFGRSNDRLLSGTQANTLLVITTNDSGPGSLRQAILDANTSPGPDIIVFNIPAADPGFASGVFTIHLASQLPVITGGGVTIDGSTQVAFTGPTNGSNPVIAIDGAGAGVASGFVLHSDNNVIRELIIAGFNEAGQAAIAIQNGASGNLIEGCLIGTNSAGTSAVGNNIGVLLDSGAHNNTIGGTTLGARNIISGDTGVLITGEATEGNLVVGNSIGVGRGDDEPFQRGDGVRIENGASNNHIGLPEAGNSIVLFKGNGIAITGHSTRNRISGNALFFNGGLGIDLGSDGVTPNDPGDGDSGPNELQNSPVLTSALNLGNKMIVSGTLDTNPGEVRIEFFANEACDKSGSGQGQSFLGATTVLATGDPGNPATFTAELDVALPRSFITATATDVAGNTSEFSACMVANTRPIADAGPDQTVTEGTEVALTGAGSRDDDGDPLTFRWQQTAGPTVALSDSTSPQPRFTAPILLRTDPAQVVLTFELVVNDGKVDSEPDAVNITVNNINQRPTANAGPDQTVNEATTVTLDGTLSSDLDQDPLIFRWQQTDGPTVSLSDPSSSCPTFAAPALKRTDPPSMTLTFELTVTDGVLASDPSRVTITVTNINRPPVANAGPDQTVNEASVVTLDGTGSADPDDDPLTFSWRQTAGPPVTLSDPSSPQPSFHAPTLTRNDPAEITFHFELIVNDGQVTSAADTVEIKVINVNQPPVANAGPDQTVDELAPVTLDGRASSDVDLDPLSFRWEQVAGPSVTLSDAAAAQPTFTAPLLKRTDPPTVTLTFRLIVSDGVAMSAPDTVDVIVRNTNQPPLANAGPDQSVNGGALVTLDGTGSTDLDDDPLTFSWRQTAGPPVTLSDPASPRPTFTAPTDPSLPPPLILMFELTVNDGTVDGAPDTVTITVNRKPIADAGPDQKVDEGTTVTLDGTASRDPDGDPITFLWKQVTGPAVPLSDPTSPKPTFVAPTVDPAVPPPVVLTFELVVSDGKLTSEPDRVNITLNRKPIANAGPDQKVNEGTTVTLDGTASRDPDGDSITFLWKQTAGPSVTLSDATSPRPRFTAPVVSPAVPPPVTLTFELVVNDGRLSSVPDTVVITVNRRPIANAGPDQTVADSSAVPVTVTLDGTASRDPDGDTISFRWQQTAGPPVILIGPYSSKPSFTAPALSVTDPSSVVLTFSLIVNDGRLDSAPDTVDVTVQNVVRLDDRNRNGNYLEINLATNAFEFRAERTGQVFTGTITNITRGAGDGNQIRMSGASPGGISLAVNIDVRRNVATAVLMTGSDTFTIFTSNVQ